VCPWEVWSLVESYISAWWGISSPNLHQVWSFFPYPFSPPFLWEDFIFFFFNVLYLENRLFYYYFFNGISCMVLPEWYSRWVALTAGYQMSVLKIG
jgi:hypothetical protein